MTLDARQSLTAFASVTLFMGLFLVLLKLIRGIDIPEWMLPAGLILMTIDFAWRFVQWLRERLSPPASEGRNDSN